MRKHAHLPAVATAILLAPLLLGAAPGPSPHQIVKSTGDTLAEALDNNRARLESNPQELYDLVDEVLRPNFDITYAGRLIMGRHWSTASTAERDQFVAALYASVVRRYGNGLLEFNEDRIKVVPPRELLSLDDEFITVKTEVHLDDGTMVPVNYRTRWTDETWKVFDVIVEGRSYVSYYRDEIGRDIAARGLPEVIEQLKRT